MQKAKRKGGVAGKNDVIKVLDQVYDPDYVDSFVNRNILNLDFRFSTLYLVGRDIFQEFSLNKNT